MFFLSLLFWLNYTTLFCLNCLLSGFPGPFPCGVCWYLMGCKYLHLGTKEVSSIFYITRSMTVYIQNLPAEVMFYLYETICFVNVMWLFEVPRLPVRTLIFMFHVKANSQEYCDYSLSSCKVKCRVVFYKFKHKMSLHLFSSKCMLWLNWLTLFSLSNLLYMQVVYTKELRTFSWTQ